MAVEVAEGRRGDIGPQRVQKIVEWDTEIKSGHRAAEELGRRGTEDHRGGRGPRGNIGPQRVLKRIYL